MASLSVGVSYSKVTNMVKETLQAACEQQYHPAYVGEAVPLFCSFEGGNSRHAWELQSRAFKLRNKRPRRQWQTCPTLRAEGDACT